MLIDLSIKHITLEDITHFGYQYHLTGERKGTKQNATLWCGSKQIDVVVKFYRNGMAHIHKVIGPFPGDEQWLHGLVNDALMHDENTEYFVHKSIAHDTAFLVGCIQFVILFLMVCHIAWDFPYITVMDGLMHLISFSIVCILGTFYDKIYSKTWQTYLEETEEENKLFPPEE